MRPGASSLESSKNRRAALSEPVRRLRDVGVPDEHVLAERDVAPEKDESEQILAQVVEVLFPNSQAQVAGPVQQRGNQDQCGETCNERPGQEEKEDFRLG